MQTYETPSLSWTSCTRCMQSCRNNYKPPVLCSLSVWSNTCATLRPLMLFFRSLHLPGSGRTAQEQAQSQQNKPCFSSGKPHRTQCMQAWSVSHHGIGSQVRLPHRFCRSSLDCCGRGAETIDSIHSHAIIPGIRHLMVDVLSGQTDRQMVKFTEFPFFPQVPSVRSASHGCTQKTSMNSREAWRLLAARWKGMTSGLEESLETMATSMGSLEQVRLSGGDSLISLHDSDREQIPKMHMNFRCLPEPYFPWLFQTGHRKDCAQGRNNHGKDEPPGRRRHPPPHLFAQIWQVSAPLRRNQKTVPLEHFCCTWLWPVFRSFSSSLCRQTLYFLMHLYFAYPCRAFDVRRCTSWLKSCQNYGDHCVHMHAHYMLRYGDSCVCTYKWQWGRASFA